MPARSNTRQPLSCENCRERKIKCNGGPAPCVSCVKRGYGLSCNFKRQHQPQLQISRDSAEYRNLEAKIDALESLLKQHIEQVRQNSSIGTPQSSLPDTSGYNVSPGAHEVARISTDREHPHAGCLKTSETGHVRFIPQTSALDSPDLVEFLGPSPGSFPIAFFDFPFSSDPTSPKDAILDMLPPNRHCDELVTLYLNVFSPLFHILHDPSFEAEYVSFKQAPNESSLSFLALLFVILSVATTATDSGSHIIEDLAREGSSQGKIKRIASRYRMVAMKCLSADGFLWRHNLHTVKALVLLLYALNHSEGPAWPLLGTTVNIAIAIGCHVDPFSLNVDVVEAEERRRCWAGLMMLHQIQSTCMARPLPLASFANVLLPADVDDRNLMRGASTISTPQSDTQTNHPTQMSYLLYKFKLYRIASALCQAETVAAHDEADFIDKLDRQIELQRLEHVQRFDHLEHVPFCHQVHRHILSNYTNHLSLLLHRRLLTTRTSSGSISPATRHSLSRCKAAATAILDSHGILYAEEPFRPYKWYLMGLGCFHAFLASSTLLTIYSTGTYAQCTGVEMVSKSLDQIDSCIRSFEAVRTESDVCSKGAPILRRMMARTHTHLKQHGFNLSEHIRIEQDIQGNDLDRYHLHGPSTFEGGPEPLSDIDVDFDGWAPNIDLDAILSRIPTEQWLAPYAFPWNMS